MYGSRYRRGLRYRCKRFRQCFRLIDGRTMWRYMARRRCLIPEKQDLYFEIKCKVKEVDGQDFF